MKDFNKRVYFNWGFHDAKNPQFGGKYHNLPLNDILKWHDNKWYARGFLQYRTGLYEENENSERAWNDFNNQK